MEHRMERWRDHSGLGGTAKTSWRLFNLLRDKVSIFICGELKLLGSYLMRHQNNKNKPVSDKVV